MPCNSRRAFLQGGACGLFTLAALGLGADATLLPVTLIAGSGDGNERSYDIPAADANRMLDELCERPLIEKCRYTIHTGPITWEVDEFGGDNRGLVVAEVELARPDQPFERPALKKRLPCSGCADWFVEKWSLSKPNPAL